VTNEIPTLRDPQDRRLPRISPPCGLVIFGITGDLARKKLLPAIYDLANRGLLHPAFSLTGFARRDWSPQDFEEYVRASIEAHTRTGFNEGTWNQLRSGLRFVSGTFDDPEAYRQLADTVAELDRSRGTGGNHAFYLSIPPSYFPVVAKHLSDTGLNKRQGREWRRVIIEKPFGHNLESARELSDVISQIFDEQDVFRIDHYLGKETVQNIMAMRFANAMFEPLWKANYVDSVQITMAEDIGIGTRAGYYDGIGAARDIIQNHLLQLMALTAMEEPVHFTPEEIRAEKEKVLSAVRLPEDLSIDTARGQYAGGWQGGDQVRGGFVAVLVAGQGELVRLLVLVSSAGFRSGGGKVSLENVLNTAHQLIVGQGTVICGKRNVDAVQSLVGVLTRVVSGGERVAGE